MFKKEDGLHYYMTTPPSSPSLLYSGGEFDMNNNGNRLDPMHATYANSPPVSPMRSLSQTTQNRTVTLQKDSSLPPLHSFHAGEQHTILYSGEMILSSQSRFSRQKRCYCILTPTSLVRFKSFDKAKKAYPVLKGGDAMLAVQKSLLHDQKVLVALEHVFAIYKIQLSSFQEAIRINFVDPTDLSKQSGSLTLIPITNDASSSSSSSPSSSPSSSTISLVSIWIHALRTALEPYLPGLITVGSAEQLGAIERTKKQNDHSSLDHSTMVHKVMLKTKKANPKATSAPAPQSSGNLVVNHIVPSAASGSSTTATSTSSATPTTSAEQQKDVYIPVIFLLGHNSLYLLPSRSDYEDYRRYVSRDRYGLMAITGITIHDKDDTITITLCTVQGPSHRLKLISSVGRLLVCAIQKAIQQLVPHFPTLPYTLVCPTLSLQQQKQYQHRGSSSSSSSLSFSATTTDPIHINTIGGQTITALSPIAHWLRFLSQPWQQQKITSLQKQTNEPMSLYTTVTTHFDSVLMAYCAALNLDKRRFRYTLEKSQRKSRLYAFTVLPSNEINGNFTSYSKYELLAIFRTLRHIDFFETISFKDIRLVPLETWAISKDDGWTLQESNSMCFPTMLANEVFLLLSYNSSIQSLDFSGSQSISRTSDALPVDSLSPSLGLTRLPTTRSLVQTNSLTDGTPNLDQITPTSSASGASYSSTISKCQQCMVQAILLSMQTNKSLNLSSLTLDGYTLHEHDTDLLTQLMLPATVTTNSATGSTILDAPDLPPMMGLRSISLRRAHISVAGLEDLLLAITQGPVKDRIECLDLQENDGPVSAEVFTQIWQQCTRLSQLGVSCHLRSGEKLDLARYPKVMNKLDLSGSTLEDEHLLELCGWLTHHANNLRPPTKTQFDLCLALARCGLHGQHVHQLVHAVSVPHHRRLQFTLELGDNPLTKQVVYQPWLWSSLSKYGPTCLKLQNVMWESATLRELFDSLIQNKMVEKLDLSYAFLDKGNEHDASASSPASPTVEERPTIATTYSNLGGGTTAKRFSISSADTSPMTISTSSQISTGDIAAAPTSIPVTFDPTTVQALASLVQKMTHLTSFIMDAYPQDDAYTPISTNTTKSIPKKRRMTGAAQLLSSTFRHLALSTTSSFNSSITTISVKHQGLGDATIQALCQWGKQCPSLQSLYVDGNLLTISGFRSLLDLVKTNSSVYDLPRPELDFRRELQRLESEAWYLQESEGELQYLVIHMVGVDSKRAKTLIEEQVALREAIMVDRSQLPIVADQLEQYVESNDTLYQRKSRHMVVQPYWPSSSKMDRPASSFSTTSASSNSSVGSGVLSAFPVQSSMSAPPTRKSSTHKQQQQQQQLPSPALSPSNFMNRNYRQRRPSSSSSSSVQSFYHEYPAELLPDALPPPTCPLPAIPSSSSYSTPY